MTEDSAIMKSPLALSESASATAGAMRAIALIVIVLGSFALLWPTTASLVERWADTVTRAYTHGSMIVLISGWMLWRRRALVASIPAQPSWLGFAATVCLGFAWLFAYRSGIQIGHQLLLPLVCLGLVATTFGLPVLRRMWPPIAYLFFTIPVWDLLNPSLQWISAYAVRLLLSLVGIPVYFDGLEFQIPAGRFEIAGGCSGLHFFIVSLAIAVLYGEVNNDSRGTRLKLLGLAVMFAFVTNWIRIAIIIVVGHQTQMEHHLVQREHYTFGWGMFAIAMFIFFLIVRRWPAAPAPAADLAPQASPAVPFRGVVLACIALAAPAIVPLADANGASADRAAALRLPRDVSGWRLSETTIPSAPVFLNADSSELHDYSTDEASVQAFGAVYLEQRQAKELANFDNRPFGDNFAPVAYAVAGEWLEVRARDRAGRFWLAHIRYRIDDSTFVNLRRAQIAYALASLAGDPLSSVIVLRTPCATDCDAARATLDRFAADAKLASVATP
jgi:exosortase A